MQPSLKHLFILMVTLFASVAHAGPIAGLYNTGQGLTAGAQDTRYRLIQSSADNDLYGYVASNNSWPVRGPWLNNSNVSSWLTPTENASQSLDPLNNGTYIWSLDFDLTELDAGNAYFSARWAADNLGTARLNGQTLSTIQGFRNWSYFNSVDANFLEGINTLEFEITNLAQRRGNPAGFRVEFIESEAHPVTEPSTLALIGFGLAGLALARRKQR